MPMSPDSEPPAARRRILIVDADHRVRRDLGALVALETAFEVVGATGSIAEALHLVDARDPHVVVVDPRLPEIDAGMAFIAGVTQRSRRARIVVMSCAGALESPAMARGAFAFVAKNGAPGSLLEAIAAAADAAEPGNSAAPADEVVGPAQDATESVAEEAAESAADAAKPATRATPAGDSIPGRMAQRPTG